MTLEVCEISNGVCMADIQTLNTLRSKIDEIDNKVLELLNHRADISAAIGDVKKHLKIEIFDRNRESIILNNLEKKCRDMKIDFEYIKDIWSIILNKSHEIQMKGK